MVRGDGSDRTFLLNAGVVFLYPCHHCGDPAATVPFPECLRPPRAQHSVQGLLQGAAPGTEGSAGSCQGPFWGPCSLLLPWCLHSARPSHLSWPSQPRGVMLGSRRAGGTGFPGWGGRFRTEMVPQSSSKLLFFFFFPILIFCLNMTLAKLFPLCLRFMGLFQK